MPYIICNKLFSNSCLVFNLNYYKFVVLDVHTLLFSILCFSTYPSRDTVPNDLCLFTVFALFGSYLALTVIYTLNSTCCTVNSNYIGNALSLAVTFEFLTAVTPSTCFVLVREGLMIWYREWEFLGAFEMRQFSSCLSVRSSAHSHGTIWLPLS